MEITKGKRNLALVMVSFAMGMLYFVPYIRFSFYDQTLEVFNINNTQMGMLGSVFGAVAIVCYLISGFLSAKIQPKYLISASCFGCSLVTLWLAQLPGFTTQIIIYVLFAILTIAMLWSPYLVIVRNLGTDEEQGRLLGISDSCRSLFSAVAGFAFVAIFGMFANNTLGYKGMLYVSVGLYVLFGILCLVCLPKVTMKSQQTEEKASKKDILAAFKIPGVWLMGLFIFSCYSTIITQTNFLGTYTTQILGVDPTLSSAFAVLRSYIIPVIAGIVGGMIVDKSKSRTLAFVILMAALGVVDILTPMFESNLVLTMILTMIISMLAFMVLATYWSIMSDCGIPVKYTAVASGIVACIAYIPDAYITLVIGKWIDADPASGFNKMFIWMAVWAFVAAAVAFIIMRREKKNNV